MKKSGKLFIAIAAASLVLYCAGLLLNGTGFITLPTYVMIATGVVLCIGYSVVPGLSREKTDYEPKGKILYVWLLILLYDLAFLAFLTFLVVQRLRLMRGA